MAKYSLKKASKNTLIGAAYAVLPTILAFLVTKQFLDNATANLISSVIGVFALSYGVEAVSFANRSK